MEAKVIELLPIKWLLKGFKDEKNVTVTNEKLKISFSRRNSMRLAPTYPVI